MTREEIIRQLQSLRASSDYQADCDPEEDIWRKDVEALDAAIDLIRSAENLRGGTWIPVTPDTMPPKFEPVFVCRDIGGGERKVEQGFKDFGDWWKVYGTRTKKVTHWMPLPEPPEEG